MLSSAISKGNASSHPHKDKTCRPGNESITGNTTYETSWKFMKHYETMLANYGGSMVPPRPPRDHVQVVECYTLADNQKDCQLQAELEVSGKASVSPFHWRHWCHFRCWSKRLSNFNASQNIFKTGSLTWIFAEFHFNQRNTPCMEMWHWNLNSLSWHVQWSNLPSKFPISMW